MYWLVAKVLWNETAFPSVMPRTAAETRTVDSSLASPMMLVIRFPRINLMAARKLQIDGRMLEWSISTPTGRQVGNWHTEERR